MGKQFRLVLAAAVLAAAALGLIAAGLASNGSGHTARTTAAAVATTTAAVDPHPIAKGFKPNGIKISQCGSNTLCFEQAFGNLVYHEGPKAAFKVFDADIAKPGPIQVDCHRIAHRMGAGALLRFHGDVAKAFSAGSSSCWSGYYHGILEWAFLGTPPNKLGAKAAKLCRPVQSQGTFLFFQCLHGLGHGLMITTGYTLPLALKACHALDTGWDQQSCEGGVFMENIATAKGSPIKTFGKPKWLRDNDLLFPCDKVADADKSPCYLNVTSRILQANGYDFAGAARLCHRADVAFVDTCFQSLGRDASGSSNYDIPATLQKCNSAGSKYDQCIWGASRDFGFRYAGGGPATKFCNAVPARFQPTCFDGVGTVLATLFRTPAEQARECRRLTTVGAKACIEGARRSTL